MVDTMSERHSYREAVADLFKRKPGVWIHWTELAAIGGALAWRSRVAELRPAMTIDNRVTRRADGTKDSWYRYSPNVDLSTATQADFTFGESDRVA